jgi:CelD/BcsL family acetyltransferase involved in cellulose biosynthesis
MSAAGIVAGLARERADASPRRIAAGRVEWKPLVALADERAAWRELAAHALEPNVFYDPAFALPAAPVFGDPGAVLAWSKAGRLIGLFPARVERRYGVMTALTGWTHPYAPFGVPLVDLDEAEAAITAFLDHAEAQGTLALLPLIAADGPFAAALSRVLARRGGAMEGFGAHARAMLAPRGARIRYLDSAVSAKKLKELRRQRRRLLDKGLLTTLTAQTADEIPRALADYFALEKSGWKGRKGSAAAQHAPLHTFMRAALTALAAEGHARIDRLMQNARPLATTITLRSRNAAWFWKIAYDEDFSRASPGVQATLDLTEALLLEPEIARVDSCATAGHPMIEHLWRERLALADYLIAPSAAAMGRFRVARHLETLRRVLVSAAKKVRDGTRR